MYDRSLTIEENLTMLAAAPSRLADLTEGLPPAQATRFHLCLRQGAGKQFSELQANSVKAALARSTHQLVPTLEEHPRGR